MKTTLEMPDALFRRAKSQAAEEGIPLRQLVTEAVEQRLKNSSSVQGKPWMKHVGKLDDLREETARINQFIEDVFERIDPVPRAPESQD
jgi:hypothetical protein